MKQTFRAFRVFRGEKFMPELDETNGITALRRVKLKYQKHLQFAYEAAAQDCATCPTPGACCLDAHFVNVHITRLEAAAIYDTLAKLPAPVRQAALERARNTVTDFNLTDTGDTCAQTYSCPLFVRGVGCLVHEGGDKPAPCIQHACYENAADVPPTSLQVRTEDEIERLNTAVYGAEWRWRSLPLWLIEQAIRARKTR